MRRVYSLGDPEVNPGEVDDYLKSIDAKLSEFRSSFFDSKLPDGRVYKSLMGQIFNRFRKKPAVLIPGDFAGIKGQQDAITKASEVYLKIRKGESLDEKLSNYVNESGLAFTDESAGNDLAQIYSDVLFDKDLGGGLYTELFNGLEKLAKKHKVDMRFVLGNNDPSAQTFKSNYESLGLKRVKHIADGQVDEIGGFKVLGYNGSSEHPRILEEGSIVLANLLKDHDRSFRKKIVEEYNSKVACTSGFKVPENLKEADVLLCHKAYNQIDGEFKWGKNPGFTMFADFPKLIDKIIAKVNPRYVVSGHDHNGAGLEKDGIIYMNPGIRGVGVDRGSSLWADLKLKRVLEPSGDFSRKEKEAIVGATESTIKQLVTKYLSINSRSRTPSTPSAPSNDFRTELNSVILDKDGLANKLRGNSFSEFPELEGMKTNTYGGGMSVLDHTLKLYDYLEKERVYQSMNPGLKGLLNLSVLLHDVVKRGNRVIHPNHELDCAVKAKELLTNWGYDQLTVDSVETLVKYHSALGSIASNPSSSYDLSQILQDFMNVDPRVIPSLIDLLRLLNKADMGSISGGRDGNTTPVTYRGASMTKGAAVDQVAQELLNMVLTSSYLNPSNPVTA